MVLGEASRWPRRVSRIIWSVQKGIDMGTRLEDYIAKLPLADQRAIRKRADELTQRVLTLRALRRELGLTQKDLADMLDVDQPAVSKLERCQDYRVGTLARLVAALGGRLELIARIPGRPPVRLYADQSRARRPRRVGA